MRVEPTLGSASDWQSLAPRPPAGRPPLDETALYAAAIGPKNQDHYLSRFKAFDRRGGTRLGWHWPAFLWTLYWLLYRKLWWHALVYFFAPYVLLTAAAVLVPAVGADRASLVFLAVFALLFVVPALLADGFYFKHCRRLIERARAESSDPREQKAYLERKGGTSRLIAVLFYVLFVPGLIGIVAAVALPAYQDYTVRAKIQQALVQAKVAGDAVGDFYGRNRRVPRDLAEAGHAAAPSPDVRDMRVDARTGVITVTMGTSVVAGLSFVLQPEAGADGRIAWRCGSQEIPARLLPRECR